MKYTERIFIFLVVSVFVFMFVFQLSVFGEEKTVVSNSPQEVVSEKVATAEKNIQLKLVMKFEKFPREDWLPLDKEPEFLSSIQNVLSVWSKDSLDGNPKIFIEGIDSQLKDQIKDQIKDQLKDQINVTTPKIDFVMNVNVLVKLSGNFSLVGTQDFEVSGYFNLTNGYKTQILTGSLFSPYEFSMTPKTLGTTGRSLEEVTEWKSKFGSVLYSFLKARTDSINSVLKSSKLTPKMNEENRTRPVQSATPTE